MSDQAILSSNISGDNTAVKQAQHIYARSSVTETILINFPSSGNKSDVAPARKQSILGKQKGILQKDNISTSSPTISPISSSSYVTYADDSIQSVRTYADDSIQSTKNNVESSTIEMPQLSVSAAQYSMLLSLLLSFWIFYLILPKGLRQLLCNAYPKRYSYSKDTNSLNGKSKIDKRRIENRGVYSTYSSESSSSFQPSSSSATSGNHESQRNNNSIPEYQQATLVRRHLLEKRSESGIYAARMNFISAGSNDSSSVHTSQGGESFSYLYNNHHQTMSGLINKSFTPTSRDSSIQEEEEEDVPVTPKPSLRRKQIIDSGGSAEELDTIPRIKRPSTHYQDIEVTSDCSVLGNGSTFSSIVQTLFFGKHEKDSGGMESSDRQSPPPPPPRRDPSLSTAVENKSPSPHHPDPSNGHMAPSQIMLSSTMIYLRDPGVRLQAHGTQCKPRRIWLRLDPFQEQIAWRTENDDNTNSSSKSGSVALGPVHEISIRDILYVDVGKTTAALRLLPDSKVANNCCFSLLTKSGSLDLQAKNALERDALVSCFCMILDSLVMDTEMKDDHNDGESISGSSSSNTASGGGKNWRDLFDTVSSSVHGSSANEGSSVHTGRYNENNHVYQNRSHPTVHRSKSDDVDARSIAISTSSGGVFTDIEQSNYGIGTESSDSFQDLESNLSMQTEGTDLGSHVEI